MRVSVKPRQPAAITPPEEGLQPPWLMSFADFVSCLLACFVLLFSMVSLDKDKFQKIIGSIPGRANLDLQAPQGRIHGDGLVALDDKAGESHLNASFERLDVGRLSRALGLPYGALTRADGRVSARWPLLEFERATGDVIRFNIGKLRYTGRVAGDTMAGQFVGERPGIWNARR
jgi:hypothetical protein